MIDWAVMTDPFGNEFCLVSELTDDESQRVRQATNATTDQQWRAAAGRTPSQVVSRDRSVTPVPDSEAH